MQAILEWVKLRHCTSPKLVFRDVVANVKSTAPLTTWVLFFPPHPQPRFIPYKTKKSQKTQTEIYTHI